MEEILAKFIDEGKREHEEMKIFIKEFRTTNKLLLKTRSNLLSELKSKVNDLSKVVSNVLIPKKEVKGVTTRGGKMTSEATRSKEINETEINKNKPPRFEEDVKESRMMMVLSCPAQQTAIKRKRKRPRSFTTPCQVLEKHKEAEDLAADHLSRFENPHIKVLTEREIADKFSNEHLMVLKSKFNNDEPWYADFVNYIVGKEPYAFKLCEDNIMRRFVAGSKPLEILARCHSGPTGGHYSANVIANKVYESEFIGLVSLRMLMKSRGNKYILVAVDYVSKWVESQALPTNDERVVVKFLRSLFARFGVPKALISDRGTNFCNSQLKKALQRYGTTYKLSTSYHPQSNGQTEVTNRAIKLILERSAGTILKVKEKQEKDKIGSKPDKNRKRVEAGKSLKQLQWVEEEKLSKTQKEWSKTQTQSKAIQTLKE
nr:hypothetical protein [Tanacetum cinerariifolium]